MDKNYETLPDVFLSDLLAEYPGRRDFIFTIQGIREWMTHHGYRFPEYSRDGDELQLLWSMYPVSIKARIHPETMAGSISSEGWVHDEWLYIYSDKWDDSEIDDLQNKFIESLQKNEKHIREDYKIPLRAEYHISNGNDSVDVTMYDNALRDPKTGENAELLVNGIFINAINNKKSISIRRSGHDGRLNFNITYPYKGYVDQLLFMYNAPPEDKRMRPDRWDEIGVAEIKMLIFRMNDGEMQFLDEDRGFDERPVYRTSTASMELIELGKYFN